MEAWLRSSQCLPRHPWRIPRLGRWRTRSQPSLWRGALEEWHSGHTFSLLYWLCCFWATLVFFFFLILINQHFSPLWLTKSLSSSSSQRPSREEDGHQGIQHGRGLFWQRSRASRLRPWRGGRRLQGSHEHPEQRALWHGGRPLRHHEGSHQ